MFNSRIAIQEAIQMVTALEMMAGIPGIVLMVRAFMHFDDMPNFNWQTMECVKQGKLQRQDTISDNEMEV